MFGLRLEYQTQVVRPNNALRRLPVPYTIVLRYLLGNVVLFGLREDPVLPRGFNIVKMISKVELLAIDHRAFVDQVLIRVTGGGFLLLKDMFKV